MPVYPFKCENCGEIEISKKMSEPNPEQCPNCGGGIKRVFTVTSNLWRTDGNFTGRVHKD